MLKKRRNKGLRSLYIFMKDHDSTIYSFVMKEIDGDKTRLKTIDLDSYKKACHWMHAQEELYNFYGYSKRSFLRKSTVVSNTRRIHYEIKYVRKEK